MSGQVLWSLWVARRILAVQRTWLPPICVAVKSLRIMYIFLQNSTDLEMSGKLSLAVNVLTSSTPV